jgi:hypothetical protein
MLATSTKDRARPRAWHASAISKTRVLRPAATLPKLIRETGHLSDPKMLYSYCLLTCYVKCVCTAETINIK